MLRLRGRRYLTQWEVVGPLQTGSMIRGIGRIWHAS